ncbi:MAG: hypothetical protein EGQ41_00035 [Clostridiales bacterium]|nr:hypothetical protein [Clostridiales bacterium]
MDIDLRVQIVDMFCQFVLPNDTAILTIGNSVLTTGKSSRTWFSILASFIDWSRLFQKESESPALNALTKALFVSVFRP